MSRAPTCLVADDHPAMVEALSKVLGAHGVKIVARAQDGEAALQEIEAQRPDVALLDLRMPRLSGIEVARRAARLSPETAVLLYTAHGERALLSEALAAGARGLVLKEAPLPDVVRAVETVAKGGTYVDPVLVGILTGGEQSPSLSARQCDVLRLLADGHPQKEIGRRLSISTETVRTHLRAAMEKLDADSRTEAVATALRLSLIA